MPLKRNDNLAQYGIITDQLPFQIPENAWSGGQNVRVRDNKIQKFKGEETYLTPPSNWDGGAANQIYWALPVAEGNGYYWVYAGLKDVRVYDGSTDKEITRVAGDYSATADINWTGGIIGGIPVLNNGVDDPQEWDVDFSTPGKLVDLTNWPANTTCKTLRVFKNYLIALNVTKAAGNFPTLVKWSDAATVGSVPGSWDETDATVDAGEVDLAEADIDINVGEVIDCLPLRDINIVYKDSQFYAMRFIGGEFIFQFSQISKTQGILTRRCVAEFEGKHFVVGNGDIYVHDGSTIQSVVDARRRRFFFSDIDPDNYERTFVYSNLSENEMWVCYVESGHASALPNKAMVWNWKNNTWMTRELPDAPHITRGVVDTSVASDDWTVADGTWEDWTSSWGAIGFNPMDASPLICSTKLLKGDSTDQFDAVNMTSRIERTNLPIGEAADEFGRPLGEFVRIRKVYPKMEGNGPVNIYIGTHDSPSDPVAWKSPVSFTPGVDRKIDVNARANLMAIRIESITDVEWSLYGYDVEYSHMGRRP